MKCKLLRTGFELGSPSQFSLMITIISITLNGSITTTSTVTTTTTTTNNNNNIPIVISALGTFTEGLVYELEDLEIRVRVETIQTTARLRSARILRRVLES